MGFRSTSRKGLAALGALAPVLAGGYYAADPANFRISTQAEAHARDFASSIHARTLPAADEAQPGRLPGGAARLFASTAKGPRADLRRGVKVASLGAHGGDITGSLPRDGNNKVAIDRSRKTSRPARRGDETISVTHYRVENRPSSSLFLASMLSPQGFAFPGMKSPAQQAAEPVRPAGPTKLPRGLAYQGETEDEYQARQRRCLATAIYFEARGEPERGQLAVAQVVMNRVRSSIYPDTICGVVFQGQRQRKGCQFSFTCDGIADVPREKELWLQANRLAKKTLEGKVWLPEIGHASHYHATYVKPAWRRQMDHVKRVGRHIFYRVRYPQIDDILKSEENQEPSLALRPSG